ARFYRPYGVAVDTLPHTYLADSNNASIREITAGGGVTTLARHGGAGFSIPHGGAVDGARSGYRGDRGSHTIRKVTIAGVVTTLAGAAGMPGSADGAGAAARFSGPSSVAVDGAGNVYVADVNNHTIRKITAAGVVTTLAGTARAPGSADGTGPGARFDAPQGVAADSAGDACGAQTPNNKRRPGAP